MNCTPFKLSRLYMWQMNLLIRIKLSKTITKTWLCVSLKGHLANNSWKLFQRLAVERTPDEASGPSRATGHRRLRQGPHVLRLQEPVRNRARHERRERQQVTAQAFWLVLWWSPHYFMSIRRICSRLGYFQLGSGHKDLPLEFFSIWLNRT